MIVVDASALVDFLVIGPKARPKLRAVETEDLHAPHLADAEVLHALRRLSFGSPALAEQVHRMLATVAELEIEMHRHEPLMQRAWSMRHRCSAYDALYVALAESLGCPLLTSDRRLARAVDKLISVEVV